jgi:hypothetical protein
MPSWPFWVVFLLVSGFAMWAAKYLDVTDRRSKERVAPAKPAKTARRNADKLDRGPKSVR